MARRPVPGEDHDPSRREFFRTFTRQTLENAGAVVGAANELQRSSMATAREILDAPELGRGSPHVGGAPGGSASAAAAPPTSAATFRSAYRFTGDNVVLLDQRELPARVVTFEAREPNEIAAAIRLGAVTAGPILGELAAYGVALAARIAADRSDTSREQLIRAAAGTLRGARRDVRALTVAVDRVESRYDVLVSGGATAVEIADGLAAEANAIATEAATAHAAIARHAHELLPGLSRLPRGDSPSALNVLAHGDAGPLTCGLVGMATTAFRSMIDSGIDLHIWVTAATPSNEGGRVSAYQLAQLDVPHTVVPDTAVGWLLTAGPIDAVVFRGDSLALNGDVAALAGARQVAQLARDTGVPTVVLMPVVSVDDTASDLTGLLPARGVPAADVVPSGLVDHLVTDEPA
jgi:methylthioribose-1-phosphate isomerase